MKTWETPKLIVLVRNRPEETVLSACKATGGAGGLIAGDSAGTVAGGCTYISVTATVPCTQCSILSSS